MSPPLHEHTVNYDLGAIGDDFEDTPVVQLQYDGSKTSALALWGHVPSNTDPSSYVCVALDVSHGATIREYRIYSHSSILAQRKAVYPQPIHIAWHSFIESVSRLIRRDGNRALQDAKGSIQQMKLTNGRFRNPYKDQGLAISNVEQCIIDTLVGCGHSHDEQATPTIDKGWTLRIERKVAVEISASTTPALSATSTDMQSIRARQMAPMSRLDGSNGEDHGAKNMSPSDFVQVIVKLVALVCPGEVDVPATITMAFDLLSFIRFLASKEPILVKNCNDLQVESPLIALPIDRTDRD
ncbi:unnamed protein product [Peniophora sp. CBMAI 1063]|nr:unnamed protein product [Peniophora sp. CBMAI 1063]